MTDEREAAMDRTEYVLAQITRDQQAEITELRFELHQSADEIIRLTAEVAGLQRDIERACTERNEANDNAENLMVTIDNLTAEVERLRGALGCFISSNLVEDVVRGNDHPFVRESKT